jgi:alpha-1,2-mannosyltransferase
VWWALAVLVTAGLAVTARVTSQDSEARADSRASRQLISDVNVAG